MVAKKSGKKSAEKPRANPPLSQDKHPGGRPSKYRPEFCAEIIAHMRQGFSVESFPATIFDKYGLMVSKRTIYEWEGAYEEFSHAINAGRALGQKFYEELAKAGMSGNLRRLVKETPVIVNGKAILGEDGKPITQKEYEPATFNSTSWIFTMKNRFQWRDQMSLEHSGEIKGKNPLADKLKSIMADPKLAAAALALGEKLVEE